MKTEESKATIAKRRWIQAIVLVALLATMSIGWHERREVSAADIPLAQLPQQLGAWQSVQQQVGLSDGGGYRLLERTYENDEGYRINVIVQATHTRLGSLRDWSLASMAEGWSVESESIWSSAQEPVVEPRIQRLVKGPRSRVALTWYTSASSEAPTLQSAELKAWRDRLLGGKKPWASLYIIAETTSAAGTEKHVTDLAQQLAPELQQLMSKSEPH
ncbi:MAG: exosortase-associated EpsI family protein [Armatimonadetes bacterium]|nr:exosortase-associated EpsI family protein [Armatimonadota bacterium]